MKPFLATSLLLTTTQLAVAQNSTTPVMPRADATIRKTHPELHLSENYVNNWGYALVSEGKFREALGIFKLNVNLYPKNRNTYDSLAETYERLGNRKLAVDNCKRSLALNPTNTNAIEFLKKVGE